MANLHTVPRIWFHIHIPKTAGSTLRQLLFSNFGSSYFSAVSLLEHRKLSLEESTEVVSKHFRWLRCYSDHRVSLDLPFDSEQIDCRAIAFVRRPVDQVVSQYYFQKGHNGRITDSSSLSLEEFIERKYSRFSARLPAASQLARLRGKSNGKNLKDIRDLIADRKLFLFPLDQFDLACRCMSLLFPKEFHHTDYSKANQGPRRKPIERSVRERIRELLPKDVALFKLARRSTMALADSLGLEHSIGNSSSAKSIGAKSLAR